jgi:hypothetical protein
MRLRPLYLLILFTVVFRQQPAAQVQPDSTNPERVYKAIEDYSKKHRFTEAVYDLFLRPVTVTENKPSLPARDYTPTNHSPFEGRIIRSIHITTLDPFGHSVRDTTVNPRSFLEKEGNSLHIRTRNRTIRNRLLIRTGDPYDSLLVQASERLIRSQGFIRDVSFTSETVGSDSVDIYIRSADLWSIIPDGAASGSGFTLKLTDNNLAGLGHSFSNRFDNNFSTGRKSYASGYLIPNIRNSYISTQLLLAMNSDHEYYRGIQIERPFFSPLTRWAGGINAEMKRQPGWIYKNDTTRLFLSSSSIIQDYWGATAWQIREGRSVDQRTTKFIVAGRIYSIHYFEVPEEQPELADFYTNEQFFMGSIGFSARKYIQQDYLFRFGTPEDIPVGFASGLTIGYQIKNSDRWYWGLTHSWGNLYRFGYFGTGLSYGIFMNASVASEGVLKADIDYFSNLFSMGRWRFRQFVRPELTIGYNRPSWDRLTLNDGYGLSGFNSDLLTGTRRFLIVMQTQAYAPWNVIGFRFAPYMNLAFGMLGEENFNHSRLYPQIGFGVLIRNDYLLVSFLQLSFAWYPTIPGLGDNIFKVNPFRTTDFVLPDFILGKPEIIRFQ